MRHHNPTSTSYYSRYHNQKCYSPYQRNYTYTKPTPERAYVKVIKFVAEHPNCKRIDIIRALWCPNATKFTARGEQSALFSNLLYDDLIDYNYNYEYTVTQKGYDLLRKAGIKEINIVKTIML